MKQNTEQIRALREEQQRNNEEQRRNNDELRQNIGTLKDYIQQSFEYTGEAVRLMKEQHKIFMEEVQELLILQKEHRIDIMAPFESQKQVKGRLDKLEGQ